MKRQSAVLCVLLGSFLSVGSLYAQAGSSQGMWGTTVIPSFYGPGLGVRSWLTPQYGFGVEAQPSWEFNDWLVRGRFMYTLKTTEKTRYFALVTAGFQSINEGQDISGFEFDYSVSFLTLSFGAGFEKLFGFKKNKGWGLEAGYQIGSGDYEIDYEYSILGYDFSGTQTGTYEVSPLYFGGTFSYYFNK